MKNVKISILAVTAITALLLLYRNSLKVHHNKITIVTRDPLESLKKMTSADVADSQTQRSNGNWSLSYLLNDFDLSNLNVGVDQQQKRAEESQITKPEQHNAHTEQKEEPNINYEKLRRKIRRDMEGMFSYFEDEILKLQKQARNIPDLIQNLKDVSKKINENKRALIKDAASLEEVDGYSSWREREARKLSNLFQQRIIRVQNPVDCNKTGKIVFFLVSEEYGFTYLIHNIASNLKDAYETNKTLMLYSKNWYHRGWEGVFKPVSDNCYDPEAPDPEENQFVKYQAPKPNHWSFVSSDFQLRLERLHGYPFAWRMGQFSKYLLRPQPGTQYFLDKASEILGFKRPIVGVHVRRTDKITAGEAGFYFIEEYMDLVDEYFNQLELSQYVDKRRVYIASDSPAAIREARRKYKNYEILGDPLISETASLKTRYADQSLKGILLDLHLLSKSDYLVCTMSSNVCRLAYEIMQTLHPDASSRYTSLDGSYYNNIGGYKVFMKKETVI